MGLLDADAEALRTLAAQCRFLGAEVGGGAVPDVVAMACQATTDAVSTAHAGVARAARTLAARLGEMADALDNAGVGFLLDDHRSALTLRAGVTEA